MMKSAAAADIDMDHENIVKPRFSHNFRYVFLNMIALYCVLTMTAFNIPEWVCKKYHVDDIQMIKASCFISFFYGLCGLTIHWRFRGMPNRLVGRYGRAAIDIITLCVALMLHLCFPYDGSDYKKRALVIMVSLTTLLHCWGQTFHLTSDVYFHDMLLLAAMEVGIYISRGLTCIMLLLFFCCLIAYKFISYSVPSTPESIKKDMGPSPC